MKALLILVAMVIGFFALLVAGQVPTGVFVLSNLVFGWASYLGRVVPRIRVSADGLATALVCAVLASVGVHGFAAWLTREIAKARGSSVRWRWPWTAALLALVVLMFSAGIAATGIVHQAGWLLRPRAPQVALRLAEPRLRGEYHTSESHLKQMAVALEAATYDERPRFPWGRTDANGRVLHSWQSHILIPGFLEGVIPSGEIDWDKPWDDPRNSAYFRGIVVPFLNPEIGRLRDDRGYALSHYAGNRHVLGGTAPRRIQYAPAGSSQTVAAGEAATKFQAWGDPENLRDPGIGINTSEDGFGGPSGDGANLLFLDGSVRFVTRTADPAVLRALSGARP